MNSPMNSASGGEWERVVGLIGAMEARGSSVSDLNSFSWSAAIAACERAGEWEKVKRPPREPLCVAAASEEAAWPPRGRHF